MRALVDVSLELEDEAPRCLVLAGFMGSGKTTVGRLLASRLDWNFADLDEEVAARAGLTVPQIFAEQGEAIFRAGEVERLRELLRRSQLVVALGGGAPESIVIQELLASAKNTVVIHLDAPFELLYERCQAQALDPHATARPLMGARETALARFTRRLDVYAAIAHYTADAGPNPEMVVEEICAALLPKR